MHVCCWLWSPLLQVLSHSCVISPTSVGSEPYFALSSAGVSDLGVSTSPRNLLCMVSLVDWCTSIVPSKLAWHGCMVRYACVLMLPLYPLYAPFALPLCCRYLPVLFVPFLRCGGIAQLRMMAAVAACPLSVIDLPQLHTLFPSGASPFFVPGSFLCSPVRWAASGALASAPLATAGAGGSSLGLPGPPPLASASGIFTLRPTGACIDDGDANIPLEATRSRLSVQRRKVSTCGMRTCYSVVCNSHTF
jgi:hypothetical protein